MKYTVLAFILLIPSFVLADDLSDAQRNLSKAAAEVSTLSDEVAVLDAAVLSKEQELRETETRAESLRVKIQNKNKELTSLLARQQTERTLLARFIYDDYVRNEPTAYTVLVAANSVSASLTLEQYLTMLQAKATTALARFQQTERQANEAREQLLASVSELDRLVDGQQTTRSELAAIRQNKLQLLASSQGNEVLFRTQFEMMREQLERTGRFAKSARDRIGSRVWDDSGFYFNQLDSRWIDEKLGFSSSSTIGDYGCGVTSLAMVFKSYGIGMNPSQLNARLRSTHAFFDDLLDWRNVAGASDGRLLLANSPYPLGQSTIDWGFIDQQLAGGNPVIVYIDRPGALSHYVVLVDKRSDGYVMHDPIEGPFLRFESYYDRAAVYQYITFRRS
jgi:predicted  nucleic acid-binding Zn-ribbon protein